MTTTAKPAAILTARKYAWSALPIDVPMANSSRRRVIGEKAMISHITLQKDCFVPTHAHENEQFSAVLRGRLVFTIGAEGDPKRHEISVGEGEIIHLPSNVPHSALAADETIVLDIFAPPSATTGIDRGAAAAGIVSPSKAQP